jgi:hypothetical protein
MGTLAPALPRTLDVHHDLLCQTVEKWPRAAFFARHASIHTLANRSRAPAPCLLHMPSLDLESGPPKH